MLTTTKIEFLRPFRKHYSIASLGQFVVIGKIPRTGFFNFLPGKTVRVSCRSVEFYAILCNNRVFVSTQTALQLQFQTIYRKRHVRQDG